MFPINILCFSNACPEEVYHSIYVEKEKPSHAGQKYFNLLVEGLTGAGGNVEALCVPAISRKIYKGLLFKREPYGQYSFVPVINIPVLKNICMFFYVLGFILKRRKKLNALVCDVLNSTAAAAELLAAKLTGLQTVGVVTDVPTKRAFQVKNPLKKLLSFIAYKIVGGFDKYVFLTEDMNELINSKGRPYLVSEGHVDRNAVTLSNTLADKHPKKVCLYAGSLFRIYGIEYLVKAFLEAGVENSELHIYGSGEYASELEELAKNHENIRFFGLQANSHIVKEEAKATLLINPRPTGEEYTKYSFPSKNMEYMVSGTPVLTTKLPGMPREYHPFVYLIEEETASGLAPQLRRILEQDSETLHAFGMKARDFVLEHKNNVTQGARILDLLETKNGGKTSGERK